VHHAVTVLGAVCVQVTQVAENLAMLAMNGPGTTDNASVNLIPLKDGTLLAASGELVYILYTQCILYV
jgi:hypothetical protein